MYLPLFIRIEEDLDININPYYYPLVADSLIQIKCVYSYQEY